jgi:hypothetical protein
MDSSGRLAAGIGSLAICIVKWVTVEFAAKGREIIFP